MGTFFFNMAGWVGVQLQIQFPQKKQELSFSFIDKQELQFHYLMFSKQPDDPVTDRPVQQHPKGDKDH